MPLIWRYLLSQYLKIFFLCLFTFIGILLILRLDEIVHFATLGPEGFLILRYTLYQIPYVLPITIPISSLVASFLLMQQLSKNHELTALRTAGLSFSVIFYPIFLSAAFFSVLNFYIISEITTQSHMQAALLKNELRTVNPLLLLHNKHLMRAKGYYFDSFGDSVMGASVSKSLLAIPGKGEHRMNLLIADRLTTSVEQFLGKNLTLIKALKEINPNQKEKLLIENIGEGVISINDFAKMIEKKVWTLNNDHLRLPVLMAKLNEENLLFTQKKLLQLPKTELLAIKKSINKCINELQKRISAALAPFTFTLTGSAFGISLSRRPSNKRFLFALGIASLYLLCFFSAKGAEQNIFTSAAFYFLPHVFMVLVSFRILRKIIKGTSNL